MEKLMEFWVQNGSAITSFLIVFGGTLLSFVASKLFKNSTNKLIMYSMGLVTQLFGGQADLEDIRNNVEALPFVNEFKKFVEYKHREDELRLIRVKRLLLNSKLTDMERLDYQNEYEILTIKLEGKLSSNTKLVMEKLETLAMEV